jgi:hypothetical protein
MRASDARARARSESEATFRRASEVHEVLGAVHVVTRKDLERDQVADGRHGNLDSFEDPKALRTLDYFAFDP